ncbi:GNAT family N-acetyltransferase [Candidatus Pacearchaeota archaeon]|nr:GNAT family N-acetyltransferase [Candidatus Pacearchaeota archaeon]
MIKYSQKNTRIETERLILRQPTKADISDVVRNLSDLEVSRWLLVVPFPYARKDALWYIRHCAEKIKKKPQTDYSYWIELKESGEVIGGIGLSNIKFDQGKGTVGYWLGTRHHKKGYGSEALEALIDLAFKRLKLRRLEAGVLVGNPSSGVLLEKYGFKLEGLKRKAVIPKATGKISDEYFYGLLRQEYSRPRRK